MRKTYYMSTWLPRMGVPTPIPFTSLLPSAHTPTSSWECPQMCQDIRRKAVFAAHDGGSHPCLLSLLTFPGNIWWLTEEQE